MNISVKIQQYFIRIVYVCVFGWIYVTPYQEESVTIVFLINVVAFAYFLTYNLSRPIASWLPGWAARFILVLWAFLILSPVEFSLDFMMISLIFFKMLAVISFSSGRLNSITQAVKSVSPILVIYGAILVAFLLDNDLRHNFDVLYNLQIMATIFLVLLGAEQIVDKTVDRSFARGNLNNSMFTLGVEYLQILPTAAFVLMADYSLDGWSAKMLLIAILLAGYFPLEITLRQSKEPAHSTEEDVDLVITTYTQSSSMSVILEWTVWVFPLFIIIIGPQSSSMTKQVLALGTLGAMGILTARFRKLRKQLEATNIELSRMATNDKLTGVLNRVGLHEQWETMQTSENTMLFIDLDKFKPINDEYGHLVGDEVLIITAKRIQRTIRANDVVSRVGGDEFVVVCPRLSAEQVELLMERIRSSIAKPIILDAKLRLQLDASIGYSNAAVHEPFAMVINHADAAMYEQKMARKDLQTSVAQHHHHDQ